jgi:hypothetical protein
VSMLRSHIYLANNDVLKRQKQLILLLEIHTMLYQIEHVEQFYQNIEVIDLNKRKIIQKPHLVKRSLKDNPEKPFVFAYHKN